MKNQGKPSDQQTQDSIVKLVDIKAPVPRVWRAISDHRQFGEWFRVKLNEPFVAGEKSTGVTTYPGYEGYEWLAIVETVTPESLLAFHWYHEGEGSGLALSEEPTTRVEFHLQAIAGGTRLTITESGLSALPESRRQDIIRSNTQGWDIQADHIREFVAEHA